MRFILFFATLLLISFFMLGRFLDVTVPPRPVDIIVCMGGDNGSRTKKAVELFKNGYSKSGKLLMTGVKKINSESWPKDPEWRIRYLMEHNISRKDMVFNGRARNTFEEVCFVGKYLERNNLHSVMFISDPPHSRRIDFFASEVFRYEDHNISYIVTSANDKWWNKNKYFKNLYAIKFSLKEFMKLCYYYFASVISHNFYNRCFKKGL